MTDAWASAQQVINATGVTVTEAQLAQAQDDVEIFTNRRFSETPRIRARDLYWLGKAVARQAAWLVGQYGLETRLDASRVSQDGVDSHLAEDALVMAPMAARALKRCSWMRSRSVHARSPLEGSGLGRNALLEASDGSQNWQATP